MTDELSRPFRDKIRGRPSGPRAPDMPTLGPEVETPLDAILIRDVQIGPFPEASRFHPGFVPGIPRIRMTLDVGGGLRGRPALRAQEREALLALCPRLRDHDCGGGDEIRELLRGDKGPAATVRKPSDPSGDEEDGLPIAHLIEHVALEMIAAATGVSRSSGVTCAHRDRMDRFEVFLECLEPLAGRAAAILAAAVVRDLCLRRPGRLALHRRCLDLLAFLTASRSAGMVAEDASARLSCGPDEGLQVLEELVRLGYFSAAPSPYVFSSRTGVLFQRAPIDAYDR